MGPWISGLIDNYKYIDGLHFGERKHWLHDDYVKFIRLAETLIEKNQEGILAFITNHGYLDNPTFRGMRWHLLNTFDKIYILDLHGGKNETPPNGLTDKNVFDIQTGVAIIIAVKKKDKTEGLATVHHGELWGGRTEKHEHLFSGTLSKLATRNIDYKAPHYAFVPRNYENSDRYESGFCISEFMPTNVTGIVSMGDGFAISESSTELTNRLNDFISTAHTSNELKNYTGLARTTGTGLSKTKAKSP